MNVNIERSRHPYHGMIRHDSSARVETHSVLDWPTESSCYRTCRLFRLCWPVDSKVRDGVQTQEAIWWFSSATPSAASFSWPGNRYPFGRSAGSMYRS